MSCLLLTAKIPAGKRCNFSWPVIRLSAASPPPLIHQRLKHRQRTEINRKMLSVSPSMVLHKDHNIRIEKQRWLLTVIELGPTLSESSTGSQNFMPLADPEHKFHKTGIENWLPIGFSLRSSWLRTLFITLLNHWQGIVRFYKSWNKPGDVSLPWNCASVIELITQSSINPQ